MPRFSKVLSSVTTNITDIIRNLTKEINKLQKIKKKY